jgi:hypothetical protein
MSAPDLMGDDFRQWFEARLVALHAWAAGIVTQGGEVHPAIIVIRDDGEIAYMPLSFDTVADKNIAAALHRMTASLPMGRDGAIMVSEAWILPESVVATVDQERMRREGISKHPQRLEIVMWNALRGDRQLIATSKINRAANRLEPVEIIDPQRSMVSGRFMADEHRKGN